MSVVLYPDHLPEIYNGIDILSEGLVNIKAAATFLATSVSSIYRFMNNGRLPYCTTNGRRAIPKVALKIFAERG